MLNRLAIKLEINKSKSAIKSTVYRTFALLLSGKIAETLPELKFAYFLKCYLFVTAFYFSMIKSNFMTTTFFLRTN